MNFIYGLLFLKSTLLEISNGRSISYRAQDASLWSSNIIPILECMPPTAPGLLLPTELVNYCLSVLLCINRVGAITWVHSGDYACWCDCHNIQPSCIGFLHAATQIIIVVFRGAVHWHCTACVEGCL